MTRAAPAKHRINGSESASSPFHPYNKTGAAPRVNPRLQASALAAINGVKLPTWRWTSSIFGRFFIGEQWIKQDEVSDAVHRWTIKAMIYSPRSSEFLARNRVRLKSSWTPARKTRRRLISSPTDLQPVDQVIPDEKKFQKNSSPLQIFAIEV